MASFRVDWLEAQYYHQKPGLFAFLHSTILRISFILCKMATTISFLLWRFHRSEKNFLKNLFWK